MKFRKGKKATMRSGCLLLILNANGTEAVLNRLHNVVAEEARQKAIPISARVNRNFITTRMKI